MGLALYMDHHVPRAITHDDDLLVEAARRKSEGLGFAGVVFAHPLHTSIGACVHNLELIAKAGEPGDLIGRALFLPL